jgi:two-component system, NarL family, response regulator DegU
LGDRVRVLVADDHPSVRENLRYLINAEDDLECVGIAKDGISCVQLCRELTPEVLVLDEDMPGADGMRVLTYLRRELPDIQVIMYTLDSEIFQAARTRGAVACVMKDERYEVLLKTIRGAAPSRSASELY